MISVYPAGRHWTAANSLYRVNPAAYNAYVRKLEELSRRNPGRLRTRARLLIVAGYAYVLAILGLVIGAAVFIGWLMATTNINALVVKLLFALVVLAWFILKALWVKTRTPAGTVFQAATSPALAARIEHIRAALDAPRADRVLLTSDFNASVSQLPRLGIFGWPRTYLTIGLPLMFAVEREQFDAVLAHEFAHLSGSHPKMGLWVFRMSRTWNQLLAQLAHSRNWGSKLFEGFVGWYEPRLRAYGFVMSRRDEFEADADAARITTGPAIAGALIALEVHGKAFTESFWPGIWRQAAATPEPPSRAWSGLRSAFVDVATAKARSEWLGRALVRHTLDDDTHPSLAERLRALGIDDDGGALSNQYLGAVSVSAADQYFGAGAEVLLDDLEQEWRAGVSKAWRQRHEELRTLTDLARTLRSLDTAESPLETKRLLQLANAVAETESPEAAAPFYERILAMNPDHAVANFHLGRMLLAAGNPRGVELIKRTMASEPGVSAICAALLREYFADRGDTRGVDLIQQQAHDDTAVARDISAERATVAKRDTLVATEITDADRAKIQAIGRAHKKVSAIWIARKQTELMPQRPMMVLVVEPRFWRTGYSSKPNELAQSIVNAVDFGAEADVLVIVLAGSTGWLYRKVRKLAGARVYSRKEREYPTVPA